MTWVVFRNSGVIDTRFITRMGVSAKETKSPIGFFGTGLKYAIAVLMREAQEMRLSAGEMGYTFETSKEEMRGKEFAFINMRGDDGSLIELPFPTEYGKKWEVWQAFRELYCNCKDEGGEVFLSEDYLHPVAGQTIICVKGDKFKEAFDCKDMFFLEDKPLWECGQVAIHKPKGCGHVFYRGIRAMKAERSPIFTYNIKTACDLTEDRTIKYNWEVKSPLVVSLLTSEDIPRNLLQGILLAPNGSFEKELDFYQKSVTPSELFLDVVGGLRVKNWLKIPQSADRMYCEHRSSSLGEGNIALTPLEKNMLEKCKLFLRDQLQCWSIDDYQIVVVDMDEGLYGMVKDEKIFLNKMAFRKGTKQLAVTLLEEYLHIHKGYEDFDRQFQDYLLELIVGLGEQMKGEVL